MFDFPCTYRGEPTGEKADCGCGLGLQPIYKCNLSAFDGKNCLIRMGNCKQKLLQRGLIPCASCNFRDDPNLRPIPQLPIRTDRTDGLPDPRFEMLRQQREKKLAAADLTNPDLPRTVEPFDGPVTRNLVYYVCPFMDNGIWQRNIEQLLARIKLFNGRKIIAIAVGEGLDPPESVQRAVGDVIDDFVIVNNNRHLGEVVAFLPMMEQVESTDRNEVTFYAHAKGVSQQVNGGVTVHRWTDMMYETCLDYWPVAERLLDKHAFAGSFKKVGRGFQRSRSTWHYSGTFYWLRHSAVFSCNWRQVDQFYGGVESWPGVHWNRHESGCIFRQGMQSELNLYDFSYFNDSVLPHYRQWQREHDQERTDGRLLV